MKPRRRWRKRVDRKLYRRVCYYAVAGLLAIHGSQKDLEVLAPIFGGPKGTGSREG